VAEGQGAVGEGGRVSSLAAPKGPPWENVEGKEGAEEEEGKARAVAAADAAAPGMLATGEGELAGGCRAGGAGPGACVVLPGVYCIFQCLAHQRPVV